MSSLSLSAGQDPVRDAERGSVTRIGLEEFADGRPPFILNRSELKLLGIAGVGFFLDAYDLFIVNQVASMLQFRYYDGQTLPSGLQGLFKAGANIGSVIGQFLFGRSRGSTFMTSRLRVLVPRGYRVRPSLFYGINLNQSVVLQQIGFAGKTGTAWTKLFKVATGNLIITALGFVPGYYVTILTIEILGRKWIQTQGFLMAALFLGLIAGQFHKLSKVGFIVCFSFLQFFFNFGANGTTYVYAGETFPTRFRASGHGISAAAGKCGALISSLVFNSLTNKIGTPNVLWIFCGVCVLGALATLCLLPETKGRDPDLIYVEELRAKAESERNISVL